MLPALHPDYRSWRTEPLRAGWFRSRILFCTEGRRESRQGSLVSTPAQRGARGSGGGGGFRLRGGTTAASGRACAPSTPPPCAPARQSPRPATTGSQRFSAVHRVLESESADLKIAYSCSSSRRADTPCYEYVSG